MFWQGWGVRNPGWNYHIEDPEWEDEYIVDIKVEGFGDIFGWVVRRKPEETTLIE